MPETNVQILIGIPFYLPDGSGILVNHYIVSDVYTVITDQYWTQHNGHHWTYKY